MKSLLATTFAVALALSAASVANAQSMGGSSSPSMNSQSSGPDVNKAPLDRSPTGTTGSSMNNTGEGASGTLGAPRDSGTGRNDNPKSRDGSGR